MNKICTSLDQSKIFIELGIDVNTADMHYSTWTILNEGEYILSPNQGQTIEELQEDYGNQIIPAWSLVALLDILPHGKALIHDKGNRGYKCICNNIDSYYFNNPVDACYEMILKLYEQKIL